MSVSAVVGQGPTQDNTKRIRSEQGRPDQVVVLVRGAIGPVQGQAFRECRPEEPVSLIELWAAGYKNFYIVSTAEREETRTFSCETGDFRYKFDVTVKVRGVVMEPRTYLSAIGPTAGMFSAVFGEIENQLRAAAKSLSYTQFSEFRDGLALVNEAYQRGLNVLNGIRILRCDFDARPGADLLDEMESYVLMQRWFEEGGRELVYAKAAISSDSRAKEKAERFIRAMEVLEKKTYDERRAREIVRVEDLSAAAERRLELQTKAIDAQINLAGRMINELGMDPERVAAAMQLAQRTSDGFTDLSHQRQLPTADPNAPLVSRPQLQPPLKLLGTEHRADDA